MEITFWGVRGSYPVPGAATVRYGGQTSCVALTTTSGASLIIDAGTGLRALGQKLARENRSSGQHFHVLLSHVHWDHIQGLPFFEPAYIPGTRISVYALVSAADELQQVISGITRQEFFPVPLESVPADFSFIEVKPGVAVAAGALEVLPIALNHPFGAVGYRIDSDGTSCAYVSDTAPFHEVLHKQHFLSGVEQLTDQDRRELDDMRSSLVTALRGVDTVIYDTHFLPEEYSRFPHYGHSTPDQAIEICREAGVKRLVLYHHAPSHHDEMMDKIAATYAALGTSVGLEIVTSYEGLTLKVGTAS